MSETLALEVGDTGGGNWLWVVTNMLDQSLEVTSYRKPYQISPKQGQVPGLAVLAC